MDWTHAAAFGAALLPQVGIWLAAQFDKWINAKYPQEKPVAKTYTQAEVDAMLAKPKE